MELVGVYKGAFVSAQSASIKLDIEAIFSACNSIDGIAENLLEYADSFDEQVLKLDSDALSVDGQTIDGVASDYSLYFSNTYSGIKTSTQNIREVAAAQYNKIQNELNEEARRQDLAAGNSK